MIKTIILLLSFVIFGFGFNVFGAEFCSKEPVDSKSISGKWKGSDSYYLQFRINKEKRLCVSILEDNSTIERSIKDVVIVKGKLRHLTYYTPSTDGYVVYANIEFTGDEMKFYWYSSYENQSGEDSYYRQKP